MAAKSGFTLLLYIPDPAYITPPAFASRNEDFSREYCHDNLTFRHFNMMIYTNIKHLIDWAYSIFAFRVAICLEK